MVFDVLTFCPKKNFLKYVKLNFASNCLINNLPDFITPKKGFNFDPIKSDPIYLLHSKLLLHPNQYSLCHIWNVNI